MGGQLNLEDLSSIAGALERFERSPGAGADDPELGQRLGEAIWEAGLTELFYRWAVVTGIENPNPNTAEQAQAFFQALDEAEAAQQEPGRAGGAGRVQFASERALQQEQAESLRQGRQIDLASFMENLREMAFDRVKDKMQLLQDVDVIMDARRAGAMSALTDALPFILPEGMTQFPGAELDQLLGMAPQNLDIPRVQLPLQEFVDAPLQASPEAIGSALDPLLGTVQQPRQVQLPVG